jgi:hypothetical protein
LRTALFRSVYRGRARWTIPHVVVEETPELAVLYVPPGTRGRRPEHAFTEEPEQLRTLDWEHVEHVWSGSHCLRLLRPGAAHCLYLFWAQGDWAFEGWYVNLQAPFRRTAISFDTRDHALDVVVEPDGSWRWKDEDHLELATRLGAFTEEEANEIRAEGERVIASWPFPTGWEQWRPDPAWTLPELPPGWERTAPPGAR